MARLHIDAQADHVLRLAHTKDPVTAVIELVWNSLDAEANSVNVVFTRSDMGAIESVSVIDNGHGMAPESIRSSFENLGGSWKVKAKVSPNIGRSLNGKYGRGRIRGFALGNLISWTTTAYDITGTMKRSVISGQSSDPTNFQTDDAPVAASDKPGTIFLARYPAEYVNRLTADSTIPTVTAAFALFLTANPSVSICFDGVDIDPTSAERHRAEYAMDGFSDPGNQEQPPTLRIIEWEKDPGRTIYLCDREGNVLDSFPADVRAPGYYFTAYVLWDGFQDIIQSIQLAEFYEDEPGDLIGRVKDQIRSHFRVREDERRAELVKQWKAGGEYPYADEPVGEAERAEREVFDYVATTVAQKIPKSRVGRKTTLGFLREVVASEPSALPRILDDLFSLPRNQHEDLERLLDRTTLSKLIAANTVIANRLDFLAALREMVFDPEKKKKVKERAELHKILERETWVFGEDYGLMLSDKGLDQVLDRHIEKLRPGEKRRAARVRRSDGSRGIVDLMMAQQRIGVSVTEYLVVELKRPSVIITNEEAGQIKGYAEAVRKDPQFHGLDVRWDFWVISTEIDDIVSKDAQAVNRPAGLIADWGEGVRIWAKTWSQLINDCEMRLRHYKQALEHDASTEHAAEYLNRAHSPEHVPVPFKNSTDKK